MCVSVCVSRTICNFSTLKMTSAFGFFLSFSVEKCVIIFYKLNSIRVSRLVTVYITLRDGFRKFSTPCLSSSSPRLLLTTKLVPAFVIFLSVDLERQQHHRLGCGSSSLDPAWGHFTRGKFLQSHAEKDDLCAGYPH